MEVHAAWLDRVSRLSQDEKFMVVVGGLSNIEKKYSKSACRLKESRKLKVYKALQSSKTRGERKQTLKRLRKEREIAIWTELDQKLLAQEADSGEAQREIYKVIVGCVDLQRGVECVILDRTVGKPFPCKECKVLCVKSRYHECSGDHARICTREGRFLDAAESVLGFYEKSKGLEIGKLRLALEKMRKREPL